MGEKNKVRNNNLFNMNTMKCCGTVLEETREGILKEVQFFLKQGVEILEIRGDAFLAYNNSVDELMEALVCVREKAGNTTILFTLRSEKEGGYYKDLESEYEEILRKISQNRLVDMIDIEIERLEYNLGTLINCIHQSKIPVILSAHFPETLAYTERRKRLENTIKKMELTKGEVYKLAFFVKDEEELNNYKEVLNSHKKWMEHLHIGIAMGKAGKVSRYDKNWCGSCMTYVCGSKEAAPGQISVEELKKLCYTLTQ